MQIVQDTSVWSRNKCVVKDVETDKLKKKMNRKTNKWVLDKIGSVLILRKSMAERKMGLFDHIIGTNNMEKRLIQGKMERKRRRGRPAKTRSKDLKEWTKLDMADAFQPATDRERWHEIIRVALAAQIVPPD